eukprot:2685455-Ditylum_brightwellii.AAC.1
MSFVSLQNPSIANFAPKAAPRLFLPCVSSTPSETNMDNQCGLKVALWYLEALNSTLGISPMCIPP